MVEFTIAMGAFVALVAISLLIIYFGHKDKDN